MSRLLASVLVACLSLVTMMMLTPQRAVASAPQLVAQAAQTEGGNESAPLNRVKKSWPWYVSRASGLLAAILLGLLVLSGVGLLTGQTYRFLEPLPAWAAHRALGVAFAAMTFLHVFVILFDKFIGFSLVDILVPFATDYKPLRIGGLELGSVYMALGILSMYAIAAVLISTHYWMNSQPRRWKLLHYLSYGILAAVFVHGLFLGTDLKSGAARIVWFVVSAALVVSIGLRLYRAHTIGKDA